MTEIRFEYQPLPVHHPFHTSTARLRVMFGAFGSGKTYAVIAEAIAWCLEQPGIRGAIVRKTVPQLRDATEPIVLELIPYDLLRHCETKKSGGHIERIIFPNGSVILFRSMDDPIKWRSLNLGFICFDEMNEISEDAFNEVFSRVRQRDITAEARAAGYKHEITRRGIWGATNPSGHDWIWERIHPDSHRRDKDAGCFISTTLDNPFLPAEYVEGLLDMPRPYVQRYVLCQFDDFAGRIYEDWTEQTHMVAGTTLPIGNQEVHWMGMDPGTRAPTAGLWVWFDKTAHRLVGVADYEQPGLSVDEHAAAWRKIEAKHHMRVTSRVADPNAITQRDRGTQVSLSSQYSRLGFHFQLGASSDKIRIPQLALLIARRQFVVTAECRKTFEAIRDYQWVDLTPIQKAQNTEAPDKVLKKNTHLVECAQYVSGKMLPKQKLTGYEELDDNQAFQRDLSQSIKRSRRGSIGTRRRQNHDLGGLRV